MCGDLVMAVSVDEHEVVPLVVFMVPIYMMDFQYVFVSKEKFAVATFALLLSGTHLRRDTVIPQWFQASKAAATSDGHAVYC